MFRWTCPKWTHHFNPRSREGSDVFSPQFGAGSTSFQSTLPRRERLFMLRILWFFSFYFNPRSREGSDEDVEFLQKYLQDFNPRSREGSDLYQSRILFLKFLFQSTLPRRERLFNHLAIHIYFHDFNPRSREGSDADGSCIQHPSIWISIHAPAKGATRMRYAASCGFYISIHAPAKGATLQKMPQPIFVLRFQSTLPRRERRGIIWCITKDSRFQSTLPRRERLPQIC